MGGKMYPQPIDRAAAARLRGNVALWHVLVLPSSLLIVCSGLPLPPAPFPESAPQLPHWAPVVALHALCDKCFPTVTPFLRDWRSSRQEVCPDHLIASEPGLRWVLNKHLLNERMSWMGSSTDS